MRFKESSMCQPSPPLFPFPLTSIPLSSLQLIPNEQDCRGIRYVHHPIARSPGRFSGAEGSEPSIGYGPRSSMTCDSFRGCARRRAAPGRTAAGSIAWTWRMTAGTTGSAEGNAGTAKRAATEGASASCTTARTVAGARGGARRAVSAATGWFAVEALCRHKNNPPDRKKAERRQPMLGQEVNSGEEEGCGGFGVGTQRSEEGDT
ncbi:hypothetical protein ZIOFF_009494 [Zingiber officinale]|uniref:Uncharacterized protein n=1 Tax=Zingiber officinale TaxID=94328 RepID=A0A8J5I3R8_ZINOF|nr:hypothetical protein ZIOFF_009494 [Zingiber officinale]